MLRCILVLCGLLAVQIFVTSNVEAQSAGMRCVFDEYITEYELPGTVSEIILDGDLAYIFYGSWPDSRLRVVDVSDLSKIIIISEINLPYLPSSSNLTGEYLMCADGLYIDISDPLDPAVVGIIDSPLRMWSGDVIDGIAYTAANLSGLRVVDISDPDNHVLLSELPMPERAWDVDVEGGYAYVAASEQGVYVVNVADPSSPFIVAFKQTPGIARSIEVENDIAYVGDGTGGLRVMDVSNPNNLILMAVYDPDGVGGSINNIRVCGDLLYCSDDVRGIYEIDISDPSQPVRLNVIQIPSTLAGLDVSDRHVAAARHLTSYAYFFERDRLPPTSLVASHAAPYQVCGMEVQGDYVYLVDCRTDIYVYDIANRANPHIATTIPMPFRVYDIYPCGDYLIALVDVVGMVTIDISDLLKPKIANVVGLPVPAVSMSVSGSVAYLETNENEFLVVDVSDPLAVDVLESYHVLGQPSTVCIENDIAYFQYYNDVSATTISIADVSDPVHIVTLGELVFNVNSHLRAVRGSIMYVRSSGGGNSSVLSGYDATDPAEIVKVFSDRAFEQYYQSVFIDDVMYAASNPSGVRAYSVVDIENISLEGYFNTGDSLKLLRHVDDNLLVTVGPTNGLVLIDISESCNDCPADTNNDGSLTPADFTAWINAFNNDLPECDQNSDGSCSPDDLDSWIANFNAGC